MELAYTFLIMAALGLIGLLCSLLYYSIKDKKHTLSN